MKNNKVTLRLVALLLIIPSLISMCACAMNVSSEPLETVDRIEIGPNGTYKEGQRYQSIVTSRHPVPLYNHIRSSVMAVRGRAVKILKPIRNKKLEMNLYPVVFEVTDNIYGAEDKKQLTCYVPGGEAEGIVADYDFTRDMKMDIGEDVVLLLSKGMLPMSSTVFRVKGYECIDVPKYMFPEKYTVDERDFTSKATLSYTELREAILDNRQKYLEAAKNAPPTESKEFPWEVEATETN